MFESRKHYEWEVPPPMREPGVTYWRTLSLAWTLPWFVMTIRWHKEDALQNFLIASDADLVGALQSVNGRGTLEALACCVPSRDSPHFSWSMRPFLEVWMGSRPGEKMLSPACIDGQHRLFAGPGFEPAPEISLAHLVAKVGEIVRASPRAL
jgi:hypothetical protein